MGNYLSAEPSPNLVAVRQPFCRANEAAEILEAIRNNACQAVFISADVGLGSSTILRALGPAYKSLGAEISIHGADTLRTVSFGVLSGFVDGADYGKKIMPEAAIRGILAVLEARRSQVLVAQNRENPAMSSRDGRGMSGILPALILVDDAHALDPASAELLKCLVFAGAAKIVATYHSGEALPDAFETIWSNGKAEIIELDPLTLDQAYEYCEDALGAPVLQATVWHVWHSASGNPLLMGMLLREAYQSGQFRRQGGVWVLREVLHSHARSLREHVSSQIGNLSENSRNALNTIAFSEPVDSETVRELFGENAVVDLLSRSLIQTPDIERGYLRVINPIYSEFIRELLPASQRRELYERLAHLVAWEQGRPEGKLRRISWAIESGIEVSEESVMSAAVLACKLYQNPLALQLIERVTSAKFESKKAVVKARAIFNLGDYAASEELLGYAFNLARTLEDLLFGTLLSAAVRPCNENPAKRIRSDAEDLLRRGVLLAGEIDEQAEFILKVTRRRAQVLELFALALEGRYESMLPTSNLVLADTSAEHDVWLEVDKAVALALDSERLTASGFPRLGRAKAEEAFSLTHEEDKDVYFLPEMIIFRALCAEVCGGNWEEVSSLVNAFELDSSRVVLSFGGSGGLVTGIALYRRSQWEEALQNLLPAIEAFKISDPQQLGGLCTALSFCAAAKLGQTELANNLKDAYSPQQATYLIHAHERAYMAAGIEYLERSGEGLAELERLSLESRESKHALIELNSLALHAEVGGRSLVPRLIQVAGQVEGEWAKLLVRQGNDLLGNDKRRKAKERHGLAKRKSSQVAPKPQQTAEGLNNAKLANPGAGASAVPLTKREVQIAKLAVAGYSDRRIAQELQLSIRTVEGHLYRCYAKFGISGRDALADKFKSLP